MNILVLTRNVLAETGFQNKLQSLNYEVYCSKNVLDQLTNTKNPKYLRCFAIVILSETLLNEEVKDMVSILKGSNKVLLRKTSDLNNQKEQSELVDCDLDGWIENDCSKTLLREELAAYHPLLNSYSENDYERSTQFKSQSETLFFVSELTSKERKVFEKLYSSRGKCVYREELFAEVWSQKPSKSKEVQLSAIIRKIRKKITENNSVDFEIITEFGQGYKLA